MALISCGGSNEEVVTTEDSVFVADSVFAADTIAVSEEAAGGVQDGNEVK